MDDGELGVEAREIHEAHALLPLPEVHALGLVGGALHPVLRGLLHHGEAELLADGEELGGLDVRVSGLHWWYLSVDASGEVSRWWNHHLTPTHLVEPLYHEWKKK